MAASLYLGTDAATDRPREATTVHGSRRYARARLAEFTVEAGGGRLRAETVGELLDRWVSAASPGWAASTEQETAFLLIPSARSP